VGWTPRVSFLGGGRPGDFQVSKSDGLGLGRHILVPKLSAARTGDRHELLGHTLTHTSPLCLAVFTNLVLRQFDPPRRSHSKLCSKTLVCSSAACTLAAYSSAACTLTACSLAALYLAALQPAALAARQPAPCSLQGFSSRIVFVNGASSVRVSAHMFLSSFLCKLRSSHRPGGNLI
jgi:hypothetical protein